MAILMLQMVLRFNTKKMGLLMKSFLFMHRPLITPPVQRVVLILHIENPRLDRGFSYLMFP